MLQTPDRPAGPSATGWTGADGQGESLWEGFRGLIRTHRWLLAVLGAVTIFLLRPGAPTPAVSAPGARVALETTRFLVTFATAGLLTSFGGGIGGTLRRGFIAALVVLGVTDLVFGVVPNVVDAADSSGSETLLPWIAARYLAGILFVLAGMEWPRWSTARMVGTALVAYVVVQALVVMVGPEMVTVGDSDFQGTTTGQVLVALVPMTLFAVGAVLASRLHARDQQPLERWLVAALVVGVFTQIHEAAYPVGLGPVVSSADVLRAFATILLLVGAIQQVVQLRADRIRALELSHADLRELREVSNRLQDYVAQEASFRSVVTHELATPVATISAYAHVLAAASAPEIREQAARTIAAEARRLRTLIKRMDELSGVDTDALSVEIRPVTIGPLLSEAAAFGRALPGNHPVAVRADDEVLQIDPTRMSQVLRNLVGNAARYSPSAAPIELSGRRVGGTYEVLVSDAGPGFGVDDADPLFARYRRGPSGEHMEGTGLGLWIVQEIVRAHGGTVSVLAPAEPGGRVRLRLPLTAPPSGTSSPSATAAERP